MGECVSKCSTEAFEEVVTEKDTYKRCVEKDVCGRFVPENVSTAETE